MEFKRLAAQCIEIEGLAHALSPGLRASGGTAGTGHHQAQRERPEPAPAGHLAYSPESKKAKRSGYCFSTKVRSVRQIE